MPGAAELTDRVAVGDGKRTWLGPEIWANPLPDWRVEAQTVVAQAGRNRTAHALGRQVNFEGSIKPVDLSVTLQVEPTITRAGFRIGINGRVEGLRGALLAHGVGIDAAIDAQGRLFLHDQAIDTKLKPTGDTVLLALSMTPKRGDDGQVTVRLKASDSAGRTAELTCDVAEELVTGNVALLAEDPFDGPLASEEEAARSTVRFKDWRISGPGVKRDPDGLFGPILWSQYTLAEGTLKVSVQMPPIGPDDSTVVYLEVSEGKGDSGWREIAQGEVDADARVAVLEVQDWERDTPTKVRLRYLWQDESTYWPMTIRPEPAVDEPVQIAAFSCDHGYAFPLTPMVDEVIAEDPDLVFFAGDQFYEHYGGFGVLREGPVEISLLDYLRKYYQFGWTWRAVLAHRPSVIIPDDHDVFHGNIWGEAGRQMLPGERPVDGGYQMPPRFVNAVQRTQTAHLPEPYDSTPTATGIEVYYTAFRFGPLDFAVIEDRKWKRAPGRVEGPQYDRAALADAPLLGERQERFLEEWKKRDAPFKVLLSQTMLAKPATHGGWKLDPQPRDPDCNGWPMPARDRAARILGPEVVALVGDQHLGMLARLGIDQWDDGPLTLMVPGTANGHPRAWMPEVDAEGRDAKTRGYTGQYIDGLGNRLEVLGVANPDPGSNTLRQHNTHPYELARRKGSGYGVARFDPTAGRVAFDLRRIPTWSSATSSTSFPGFPLDLEP